MSLGRQSGGSQRGLGRSGPTRGAAHLARLFAAPVRINKYWQHLLSAFIRISARTINPFLPPKKIVSIRGLRS